MNDADGKTLGRTTKRRLERERLLMRGFLCSRTRAFGRSGEYRDRMYRRGGVWKRKMFADRSEDDAKRCFKVGKKDY